MNVAGGIWAPAAMRAVRIAASRAGKVIRTKIASAARPVQTALEPVLVHASPARQPVHPIAFLRQSKVRLHHHAGSAARSFSTRPGPPPDKTKFLATKVGRAVSSFSGRAPFASTLRPNLTGGALPRSAGGYGLGSGRIGGARFFSHGPACQAQVIQNVSQAVRAFWISGQKAQFDGLNARGEARFRAVSAAQDTTLRKMSASPRAPGTNLDFPLNPTVTALGPLAAAFPFPAADIVAAADPSIATEGFLDVLSADFARALKDLTATLADLRKLAALGDLPISLEKGGHILRVRFPGVDAHTVESLCDDLGLTRGLVMQDPDFDAHVGGNIALKFPFASTVMEHDQQAISKTLQRGRNPMDPSLRTLESFIDDRDGLYDSDIDDEMEVADMFYGDDGYSEIIQQNPWLASPASSSPAESLEEAELLEGYGTMSPASASQAAEYEGVEGVYRFLEECDRARGRF